jgi:hypothetical protein
VQNILKLLGVVSKNEKKLKTGPKHPGLRRIVLALARVRTPAVVVVEQGAEEHNGLYGLTQAHLVREDDVLNGWARGGVSVWESGSQVRLPSYITETREHQGRAESQRAT